MPAGAIGPILQGIFPNSRILAITSYTGAGCDHHGKPAGSLMTVSFELNGHVSYVNSGGKFSRDEMNER
ncbi:MAG: hypothetical protein QM680_02665 [Luteolibacter sp.]